jgi:hypothetical protein
LLLGDGEILLIIVLFKDGENELTLGEDIALGDGEKYDDAFVVGEK